MLGADEAKEYKWSKLVDTHCHLHDREFFTAKQASEMLRNARLAGVTRIICIGTSHEDSLVAADFARQHEGVFWTYGIHPEGAGKAAISNKTNEANEAIKKDRIRIFSDKQNRPIAIGEVGLDYHYEGYDRAAQIRLFEEMLELATEQNLPVSFHVRESFDDFFSVVANFPKTRGVVHSFTDNKKVLKRVLNETDFYVGVNGLATYSTLPLPPLERILLETDAPFLTPKPFRGIINESAYVCNIAEWLANKLGLEFKIIEKETTKNAERLFGLPSSFLRKTRSV